MLGNSNMAAALAEEYKVTVPKMDIPSTSPKYVREVFPAMLQSLCNCFNDALKQITIGINESMENMQNQVNSLKSIQQVHSTEIASLKETLKQKDHVIQEQAKMISNIQHSVSKNESYSRRDNLVFSGFNKNDRRTCDSIIREDVFKKLLKMDDQQASAIKFVRCHYLAQGPSQTHAAIITRFESFHDRLQIWNKRRSLKNIYVTEDFPVDIARKRNKMRPILKAASRFPEYEKNISMKNDKLVLNGKLFTVDDLQTLPEAINPRTLSEVRTDDTMIFGGILSEHHELSNFFRCPVSYKDRVYNSSEQAYQHAKAVLFGDTDTAGAIMRSPRPAHQKFLASKIKGYVHGQWKTAREQIMKEIIHCKFSQNLDIAKKLCDTGDLHIGESIVKDKFYGTGLSLKHKDACNRTKWQQNTLGSMLMKERTAMRAVLG